MSRDRYERMTKDQLVEHATAMHRERESDRQHRAAIKRDLARAQALQAASITAIDAALEGPYMRELLLAIVDTLEAGHPLSSAPTENTMRVNRPDSSRDEGAPTRQYRRMKRSVRWHLERTTQTIRDNLEKDPDISEKRKQAAHYRHHQDGKHDDTPHAECSWCSKVAV